MKHLEGIINSGIFDNLKKSDYIDAFEQLDIICKTYNKGEAVFYEGEPIDRICIVEKGSIYEAKTYSSGDVHITQVFDEESIFALEVTFSKTKKAHADFISNERTSVIFVSVESIRDSGYSESIMPMLVYKLADNNIRMSHKIEILAERGLRDRVMVYLNILSKKSGSNLVTVKMNREQMAQFLCVNRSALSNELSKMKEEGIIDFTKNKFVIK